MRIFLLATLLSLAMMGCTDKDSSKGGGAVNFVPGDGKAGKAVAERLCQGCHGLDGKGMAPGIPNLAAQRERYLLASLSEYKQGQRLHAALKELATAMSDADKRNVLAYYAGLPPLAKAAATDAKGSSLYEEGKALAAACAKCHGEDGNSKTQGTPTLAGQQPHYLVAAIQEYHQGERATPVMKSMLRGADKLELEKLALYFSSQTPLQRASSTGADAAAGKAAAAMCAGCHGATGVSHDAATPSLAGQDPRYLERSIKSYRTTRQNWGMQRYVAGLSDKDIANLSAFYAAQKPEAADKVPSSTQELAEQCNRCHDADNATNPAPKMRGQDKDYLVMALRAYRDGKRENSTMHNMSSIYSTALIDSIATWYASQPAR